MSNPVSIINFLAVEKHSLGYKKKGFPNPKTLFISPTTPENVWYINAILNRDKRESPDSVPTSF